MTKDNKFVPTAPKTYEVRYVENENKVSGLSPAARAKVINRSGSNYISGNQEGFGPCYRQIDYGDCNCGFKITATLVDMRGNARSETIIPTSEQQVEDLANRVLGQGDWEYSIRFGNEFNPHQESRVNLAAQVSSAIVHHGPQRITVVEKTRLQRLLERR
ncbi:hypothetical protein [endosymbiont GvMRE of Glomus versiforme]|uniref:hypothetical protein n=1 Tax=endosymbiont GvMRE of Glomus versiforme TaxID=2039283 RepID=UPI000EE6D881|nr:hypothetical protein [endosymbiont GvMRE of Glomus versiforme]RHZ36783.1 hypothetical protein GvMRE_I2g282 [endosymbiont GvMRE of Glomus versiforme]